MLKEVIQILLITFVLVLCYDTIDIFLNQLNSKQETELLIVKREVEGKKQEVKSTTPYETYDFPIWPIALGFSCAFCSVVCHFIVPLNSLPLKRDGSKDNPHHSPKKLNRSDRNYKKENDEFTYYKETDKQDDPKHRFDIRIKDEVVYRKDLGLITSQNSSPENDIKNDSSAQLTKEGQEKSYVKVCIPNLFHDEIFPAQSSLNVINNVSFSPSLTSLEHLDCNNSKNLYNMLLENKNISKMRLPVAPRRFYGEENNRRKHFSKTFYENNCEILTVNNAVYEENTSQRSEDSNDSISVKQGHIMGLFSMLNNDVAKLPQISTSDKSVNVQLLTYGDNDIKNIEKRLENIEYGLKRSEEKTKDWENRINVAETELVDLHEQMYTIFSKFEEEKKTNYIIVSKVSNDKIFSKDIFDTAAEESDEFEKVDEKGDDDISRNKIDEELASPPDPDSVLNIKDSSEEESEDEEQSENDKSQSEENQKSVEDSTEIILSELKQRSIALEALLESKSRSQISPYLPKKKIPQLSVPPHIIPPYKRSSFAGTDSKADLRKRRLKVPNSGNELFWRTRM